MIVTLNVGGSIYTTSKSTLTSHPDTFFSQMFSGDWQNTKDEHGNIFIDRDGDVFKYILEYLRNGPNTVLPRDEYVCKQIRCEAQFYSLPGLVSLIDSISDFRILTLHFCKSHDGADRLVYVKKSHDGADRLVYVKKDISLYHLRSVPLSYFGELGHNITNNTLDKDQRARLGEDGSYYIAVGGIADDDDKCAEHAALVCQILLSGKCILLHEVPPYDHRTLAGPARDTPDAKSAEECGSGRPIARADALIDSRVTPIVRTDPDCCANIGPNLARRNCLGHANRRNFQRQILPAGL